MIYQGPTWKRIQGLIRPVLLTAWDPIEVGDVPEAADEYDSYIPGVYALLRDGASPDKIAHHFRQIETTSMGLSGTSLDHRLRAIARLQELQLLVLRL